MTAERFPKNKWRRLPKRAAPHHQGALVSVQVRGGTGLGHVRLLSRNGFLFLLLEPVLSDLEDQALQGEDDQAQTGSQTCCRLRSVCGFMLIKSSAIKSGKWSELSLEKTLEYKCCGYLEVMPAAGRQLFPVSEEVASKQQRRHKQRFTSNSLIIKLFLLCERLFKLFLMKYCYESILFISWSA